MCPNRQIWAKNPIFAGEFELKIFLVLFGILVKVTPTMKRLYTLIVLIGLAMGMLLTGCEKSSDQSSAPATNALPAGTNK